MFYIPLLSCQAVEWSDSLSLKSVQSNYMTSSWLGTWDPLSSLFIENVTVETNTQEDEFKETNADRGERRQHRIDSYQGEIVQPGQ